MYIKCTYYMFIQLKKKKIFFMIERENERYLKRSISIELIL